MPLPQEKLYTIEDIYALPEGTRAELIDGQIYYMTPPSRIHQRLLFELGRIIADYITKNSDSCEVDIAPFAVFLHGDDKSYVEPDISVICDRNKLNDRGCVGAPDWIIEIVSPSNPENDYITKLSLYKSAGVREYWIVDPRTKTIKVYFFEGAIFAQNYSFTDTVKANIYNDLYIDFRKLNI